MNTWVDLPIVEAIDYFSGIMVTAYKWANRYAMLFAVFGIMWSGFRVAMSRMQIRDFMWDTVFKWTGFFLLMSLYPQITSGFMQIGNEIGMKAGGGREAIISGMKSLRDSVKHDAQVQEEWAKGLSNELTSSIDGLEIKTNFADANSSKDFYSKLNSEIKSFDFDSKKDRQEAQKIIKKYKNAMPDSNKYSLRTMRAIDDILIRKDKNGNVTTDLTNSYLDLNMFLRDSKGKETSYIACGALIRMATLTAQIMDRKNELSYYFEDDDVSDDSKKVGVIERGFVNLGNKILVIFMNIVLLVSTIFACIQYSMTIIEFIIIMGVGAIFLPFMLFDGTKDVPKKLIPVFIGMMMKVIVITICLMFVYYQMIQTVVNRMNDYGGVNFSVVAEVLFNAIFAYMLTSNAPKIAQTILTGQPQLSMGEFVAAVGTAATTGKAMAKTGVAGTRAAAKTGINTLGHLGRGISEARTARGQAKLDTLKGLRKQGVSYSDAKGVADKAGRSAAVKGLAHGMIARPTKELMQRFAAGGNNFLHGKTTSPILDKMIGKGEWNGNPAGAGMPGGGAGGAGGGRNPHMSEALKNTTIGSAKKDDKNATIGQYMSGMVAQGKDKGSDIGNSTAQKAVDSFMKKNSESSGSSLPDSLTGNERQS